MTNIITIVDAKQEQITIKLKDLLPKEIYWFIVEKNNIQGFYINHNNQKKYIKNYCIAMGNYNIPIIHTDQTLQIDQIYYSKTNQTADCIIYNMHN